MKDHSKMHKASKPPFKANPISKLNYFLFNALLKITNYYSLLTKGHLRRLTVTKQSQRFKNHLEAK